MLDSMDVMLYALVLGQVQREMHLSAAMSGAMMSATLISAAAGGLVFGWFADRFGRVRALTLSILSIRSPRPLRLDPLGLAAHALPYPARPRHGRRVGLRRGSGCRNLARAPSRQGARTGAKFLGGWLRAGRCRGGSSCRTSAGAPSSSPASLRRWSPSGFSAGCASPKPGSRSALPRIWANSSTAPSAAAC